MVGKKKKENKEENEKKEGKERINLTRNSVDLTNLGQVLWNVIGIQK